MAKKPKPEGEEKKLDLKTLLAQVNKKYGKGTIGIAAVSKGLVVPRIPFGVFALDYATGGGIPYGRITGLHGAKSCGKTSNALRAVASSQTFCREHLIQMVPVEDAKIYICPNCGSTSDCEGEICSFCTEIGIDSAFVDVGRYKMVCPECNEYNPLKTAWYDLEGAFCPPWAAKFGVDCSQLLLTRPESAEAAIDMADGIMQTGEIDLNIIDSIAALVPMAEIEGSMEDNNVGLQARLVNKMLRKFSANMNKPGAGEHKRPTVIMINQLRQKVGVQYGSPDILPGGMGQEFATSLDIKFNPQKLIDDKQGNPQFQVSTFRCVKNKCSIPHIAASFRMWLDYDENGRYPTDTEETGVVLGLANKAGCFGNGKDGWVLWGESFKTRKDVIEYVLSDVMRFRKLREELLTYRFGELDTTTGMMNINESAEADE